MSDRSPLHAHADAISLLLTTRVSRGSPTMAIKAVAVVVVADVVASTTTAAGRTAPDTAVAVAVAAHLACP